MTWVNTKTLTMCIHTFILRDFMLSQAYKSRCFFIFGTLSEDEQYDASSGY